MNGISNLDLVAVKGSGYFCTVKKLRDKTGNEYALKELRKKFYKNEDYRMRFSREIRLLKELQGNKYIVPLIKYSKEKGHYWYLMPFAKASLYDYVKKNNSSLSKKARFRIINQVLNAVAFAHSKDILHRDISPTNVLIYEEKGKDIAKVCDFGLGKDSKSLSYYTKSSVSGYGQPWYVSPEQREKLKNASVKSDIYSLGKLIYFVFTGKDPSALQTFELASLVWKAADENPENRYKSVSELKKHFISLKELELNHKIPDEFITLRDVLASGEEYTWLEFHNLVIEGKYLDHVYTDYLEPVFRVLKDKRNLFDYYQAIGPGVRDGFEKISENLFKCFKKTGWPFNQTRVFSNVLNIALGEFKNPQIRLICLKQLWHMAYVLDQYSAQRFVKYSFNRKLITPDIQTALAEFILTSKADINMSSVLSMDDLPTMIKSTIIEAIRREYKNEKSSKNR